MTNFFPHNLFINISFSLKSSSTRSPGKQRLKNPSGLLPWHTSIREKRHKTPPVHACTHTHARAAGRKQSRPLTSVPWARLLFETVAACYPVSHAQLGPGAGRWARRTRKGRDSSPGIFQAWYCTTESIRLCSYGPSMNYPEQKLIHSLFRRRNKSC